MQVDNQNVPVEENSLPEVSSDSETSDGSDESSGTLSWIKYPAEILISNHIGLKL
jgi:hypothetical protein